MRSTILLGALLLLMSAAPALAEETPEPLSVDYVIGLLQAGMTGDAIVEHILENELAFVVRKGDIDRLLEAGAGENVLMSVLQNTWSRPRRLDTEGAEGESGEYEEESDTGSQVQYYGAFYFGWPGYYAYSPYYYGGYAYYYPYYYSHGYGGYYYGGRRGHYRHGGHYGGHGGKVGIGAAAGGYSRSHGVQRGGHRGGHSRGMSARGHHGGSSRGMSARGHHGGSGRGMSSRGHGGGRGGRGRGGGRGHR